MSKPSARRRAATHPDRPGEKCRAEPGQFVPVVDHQGCEAKDDCVQVCPYDVFEVRRIDRPDFAKLDLRHRVKVRVHGMKMAYVPGAADCRACGLCVVACPEDAIRLMAVV